MATTREAKTLTFTVNGEPHTVTLEGWEKLLDVLREQLGLTGTKRPACAGAVEERGTSCPPAAPTVSDER